MMAILALASLMSAAVSNSGTVAVFIPIILGICSTAHYSHSKLLMCAFLGAMCGGRLTLVGDAAINVLIGDQIVKLGYPFGFFEISKIGLPLTIIMMIYMYFVEYKFLPDIPMKGVDDALFESKNKKRCTQMEEERFYPDYADYVPGDDL